VIEGESDACEDELERQFIDGPATQRQREYLASIGIPVSDRLSKMEASRLIPDPPAKVSSAGFAFTEFRFLHSYQERRLLI
jgi:hypothetical protein